MDWADRRGGERTPFERELSILSARAPLGEGFRSVGVFDCSAHGIGIISDRPMQPGEQFVAKFRADSASLVAYTVRRCSPMADGRQYNIGAALTAFIGPAVDSLALDALLPAQGTSSKPQTSSTRETPSKPVTSSKAGAPSKVASKPATPLKPARPSAA